MYTPGDVEWPKGHKWFCREFFLLFFSVDLPPFSPRMRKTRGTGLGFVILVRGLIQVISLRVFIARYCSSPYRKVGRLGREMVDFVLMQQYNVSLNDLHKKNGYTK